MDAKYTRKSITNSFAEKKALQSIDNAISGHETGKCAKVLANIRLNWDKYVYTFCILYNYIAYGLVQAMVSTSLNDLKFLFRTSMANINYLNTVSSGAYLIGALAGFLYKYINRQLFLLVNMLIMGVFIALVPNCLSLWQAYICQFLYAMAGGVWDAGNSVWTIELWGKQASVYLQFSQMCFGVGTIISPILTKPYLYGDLDEDSNQTTTGVPPFASTYYTTDSTTSINPTTEDLNYTVDRRSSLRFPFMVSGAIALLGPAIMFVMFIIKRYEPPGAESQNNNEKEDNVVIADAQPLPSPLEQSPRTRKLLIALLALLLNSYSSFEVVWFGTLPTYLQYLPNVIISAPKAAEILMVLSITYTFGRFISAFISTKLKPEVMITYHLVIIAIALVILFIGQSASTVTLVYIGNAIIGFGFSAMWPSIFTFAENYVKLTDKITAIFSFTSALFALISPFIIGPLLEEHPDVFMTIEISYFCSVIVIFAIIIFIVKRSQRFPLMYTINQSPSL